MKNVIILFLLGFISCNCYAQMDSVYILFEHDKPNRLLKEGKHRDDPRKENYYPFDGGRIYIVPKRVCKFVKDITFSFTSYTPSWMDQQFEYHVVDASILQQENFKTREWFEKTDYMDILRYMGGLGEEKVIMLLDEKYLSNDTIYLVRVYFSYPAEE